LTVEKRSSFFPAQEGIIILVPHFCRELDLAVKLSLDHEREVPEAGAGEDGRYQKAADDKQQKRNSETLKAWSN